MGLEQDLRNIAFRNIIITMEADWLLNELNVKYSVHGGNKDWLIL